jgi:hypothetical protein
MDLELATDTRYGPLRGSRSISDGQIDLVLEGVGFPQPPAEQPFGWWSMFADSERNRFALEQA